MTLGILAQIGPGGEALVSYGGGKPVVAPSTVAFCAADVGTTVALLFEQGNMKKPVLVGLVRTPNAEIAKGVDAHVDGERIVLTNKREIVLSCGEASITLTQDGRVVIKGAYLLSRSSGPNKIRGGTVQIN